MMGKSSAIEHVPHEKAYGLGFGDMRRRCPNIKKIRTLIEFEPKYDLEEIAYRMGYIGGGRLEKTAKPLLQNRYGNSLMGFLQGWSGAL
jgi:hypothetical protein